MRISVITNKKIKNIILPKQITGTYWITDTDSNGVKRNLISIEAVNNSWRLNSNQEVFCIENNINKPFEILLENQFYLIKNIIDNTTFIIYCSPIEEQYQSYMINDINTANITIGKTANCTIIYRMLDDFAASIIRKNDKTYIVDNNSLYGVYVNNVRVISHKELKAGDIIFMMGLKMIYVAEHGTNGLAYYLMVNANASNNVTVKNLVPAQIFPTAETPYQEPDEEIEMPIYEEKDYFHKTPRFNFEIIPLELKIDAPPQKQEDKSMPMILTIGPMATMSVTSLITGYLAISNITSGKSTWTQALPSLAMCVTMLASAFLWPTLTRKYQEKERKKEEKLRQTKYRAYLDGKRKIIAKAISDQSAIIINNFPNPKKCEETILRKYTTIWQKKPEDNDYLQVNLGNGNYPMQIDIKYPEEHFSLVEDNLTQMVTDLGNEPKLLMGVPVIFSFRDNYISGFIGNEQQVGEYFRRLLIQLLAFHSYDNLKLIILTDEEHEYQWQFLKNCPHCFTNDHRLRFYATSNNEYKEVCNYLDKIYSHLVEISGDQEPDLKDLDESYLIITDSFHKIRDFDIINKLIDSKKNYGFSLVIIDSKLNNLPDKCQTFVQIDGNHGDFRMATNLNNPTKFDVDYTYDIDYDACIKVLANIPIEIETSGEGRIPDRLGFLELFDVGKIEQLNSPNRWIKNNPVDTLEAPVGIGSKGETLSIDIHEKYHGPHGLIAGMTGSGKSEFIISYILSLAINYHPYEVQFILIDYKGGGLAGAFENKNIGLKLPHLVGTITNLDANEINRSLASIESELKRRQTLFNQAREASTESTIDIYKYQKMFREGQVSEPISHLFIISDEFAELKKQQPEFMQQLISTARIGRSLGVHLILATQKPSGVVDPQIWSNTRFRVCLRVQDKSDSSEVIQCPDAAFLVQTGRFYFQVGFNEVFLLGQAAWTGNRYIPTEKATKTIDSSIQFIDNIGHTIKNINTKPKVKQVASLGEELINIVKYLDNIATAQNIHCNPLWLERIPAFIQIENLAQKYHYQKEPFFINPIIGEYDIPSRQSQQLLTLPFTKEGNALVYGATGSGKENFITTLIYSSMLYHDANELQYYIIDFGSGALKMFSKSPIVGDIVGSENEEQVEKLYKLINDRIEERKNLFADYSGDYLTYCKSTGNTVPTIIVIINNYESYQETYVKYEDILPVTARECSKYGIYFLITVNTPNGIRFRLRQSFSTTYVLQQNNEDDYSTILGNVHRSYPSKIFGRGIIKTDNVYEFQTATVCELESISNYIKELCNKYRDVATAVAPKIPILPEVVSYQSIASEFGKTDDLIIGLDKEDLSIVKFPFTKNFANLISTNDISSTTNLVNPLINQIIALNKYQLYVLNCEDYDIDPKYQQFYQYIDKEIDNKFQELNTLLDNPISTPIYCIIIGISSFVNTLSSDNKRELEKFFKKADDSGKVTFIIIDNIEKIKQIGYEPWYKNNVKTDSAIWVGNGIDDQYSIKVTRRIPAMRGEVPDTFCFVIKKGKPQYVKYLSNFELQIK